MGALALAIVFTGGCKETPPPDLVTAPQSFDASALEGKWYIVATDLPLWTSGEKSSPTLHYELMQEDGHGKLELLDRVSFLERGEQGEYLGKDTQDEIRPTTFNWRGSGALAIASSRWHVVYMAPAKSWGVIYYEKTLATPEGVDVISRAPRISSAVLSEARVLISGQAALQSHASGLKIIDQRDATLSSAAPRHAAPADATPSAPE